MTMRNAFADLATEASASAVAAQVATPAQSSSTLAQNIRGIFQALNILTRWLIVMPKDAQNRLRMRIDDGNTSVYQLMFGTSNNVPAWWSSGSPNGMDARQQQTELVKANALARRNKWTFV